MRLPRSSWLIIWVLFCIARSGWSYALSEIEKPKEGAGRSGSLFLLSKVTLAAPLCPLLLCCTPWHRVFFITLLRAHRRIPPRIHVRLASRLRPQLQDKRFIFKSLPPHEVVTLRATLADYYRHLTE